VKPAHQKQEHTGSYYAASANNDTRYPVLQGAQRADICIVGGGFTGVASALTLAERGYVVALVEANRIGWGASGRNGGQLIGGFSGDKKIVRHFGDEIASTVWDMRWRGHEIVHERVKKYAIDCDLKCGYIDVAKNRRETGYLEEDLAQLDKHRFPWEYRLLGKEETKEAIGTGNYVSGLINMRNGHLHPLNLCAGEARAARILGAQIFEHSPVTNIVHGSNPRVETAEGHVEADAVILAGHVFHRLEQKRLSGTTFQAGSYIIGTEPLPRKIRNEINPRDLAVCEVSNILDYYRLSADGRLLYGGRINYSGREPSDIRAAVEPRMLKVYPQLKGVRIDYQWGGSIGIVVRRIPMVGRIDGNIYYAQGYSGHGVNNTHTMGEIVADAIAGTMERFDLFAKMPQIRIPGGNYFGNQIIALGMLYYRLKDLL